MTVAKLKQTSTSKLTGSQLCYLTLISQIRFKRLYS